MASGDTLLIFTPLHNEPPDANNATNDVRTATSGDTDHSSFAVLDFDQSTDEHAEFSGIMPRNYDGGGVTITIGWSSGLTTGNVIWNTAFKSFSDDADDMDSKAFATAQASSAVATPSAAGEIGYDTTTHTDGAQMDSVAVGEYFRLRVTRDANNASDTLAGDAELVFVEIRET